MNTNDEIVEILVDQLHENLRSIQAENSIKEVIEIDQINQTITIKFRYTTVKGDTYIGVGSY